MLCYPVEMAGDEKKFDSRVNKKAQLTQGLRTTAPSFQDGGCTKMAVSRHLGYYRTGNSSHSIRRPRKPLPRTRYGVDQMHCLRDIRL